MSSATPAAFLSAISITTTSASCLSATPRATVAPTLPEPPTTVTLRFIKISSRTIDAERVQRTSHVLNDCVPEFGRLQLFRPVHQSREVVGHGLGADGPVHPL